ncbi:uncharacterized protein LAESUDRAFT_730238 [Laetiporus sulphureus 93-53]|uniref:Uncharacterized protein n=1 Tax=Laetiporus sulphureus 93-53 TaxID=1314785 RepID=A0A165CB50_9APHY|nr:uncharacterized protein LAESUDRAFT_730238 [Laetiporus sulphureus 93-53]KZT02491.1 hypothetical protein LAESUDRAFT_730238 [Laetiporus sulphureus 93-53]
MATLSKANHAKMSFQHFRLQNIGPQPSQPSNGTSESMSSLTQALGQSQETESVSAPVSTGPKKAPYGSGDVDDGYTLVFNSMAAFLEWKRREEEEKMIEFVKGDTHGSKAVPPRFKDHTKLVCARHSRSGRKKYVKKFPDRVRKVPSRKLEGVGCPASISYKTYFDSDEVRAMYNAEHSHEIGLANLPFTKRGRRAAQEQSRARARGQTRSDGTASSSPSSAAPSCTGATPVSAVAGLSPVSPQSASAPPPAHHPLSPHLPQRYQTSISMVAPPPPPPAVHQPVAQPSMDMSQERWDRMGVLFGSIRDHARTFQYQPASMAALESVLIRLYLESPMAGMAQPPPHAMGGMEGIGLNGVHEMDDIGEQDRMVT